MKKILWTQKALFFDFTDYIFLNGKKLTIREAGLENATIKDLTRMGAKIGIYPYTTGVDSFTSRLKDMSEPVSKEKAEALVAKHREKFIGMDFSSIEARVLAHIKDMENPYGIS